MVVDLWSALRVKDSRLKNLRFTKELCSESKILKSRILKWTLMIPKNPFDTGAENRGYDETGEMNEMDRFPSSSSRRGSEDTTYHRTHRETSFIEGIDEHTPLIRKENELNDSVDEIKRKFPNADTSKIISKIDEYGRVKVRLIREKGKYHLLFNSDGEVNEKLPKKIIKALGTPAEDIIVTKEEEISRREKKIDELKASRETASENQREQIDANIEEQQKRNFKT